MSGYFVKLFLDTLNDKKYHRYSERAQLGLYELLMIAKQFDSSSGVLPSLDDICFQSRREESWWVPVIEELKKDPTWSEGMPEDKKRPPFLWFAQL